MSDSGGPTRGDCHGLSNPVTVTGPVKFFFFHIFFKILGMEGGCTEENLLKREIEDHPVDGASAPVEMVVNSSDLSVTDFHLEEVSPLQLDTVTRGDRRTRGGVVKNLQGVGNSTFVLSVENDNDFRSRCE